MYGISMDMENYREICSKCTRYKTCKVVCPAIDIIADNKKSLKERYLDFDSDKVAIVDYKIILTELSIHRPRKKIEDIRQIPDEIVRIIAALNYAHFDAEKIASILSLTSRHVRRKAKEYGLRMSDP